MVGLLAAALVAVASPRAEAQGGTPSCVTVTTESRYVPYGYNHLVRLTNACKRTVDCTVSTDVNPEKQKVEVLPSSTVEVTTFMGSPAQTFTAHVACTMR